MASRAVALSSTVPAASASEGQVAVVEETAAHLQSASDSASAANPADAVSDANGACVKCKHAFLHRNNYNNYGMCESCHAAMEGFDHQGLTTIRGLLLGGDVGLLKGSWLIEYSKCGQPLPRRQELPDAALWEPESLSELTDDKWGQDCRFVVVSYCWLSREHPDPHGKQLQVVADVARRFQATNQLLASSGVPGSRGDFAVFIDWCSLYQLPRSSAEQSAFERSLQKLSVWYASSSTIKWLLTSLPAQCEHQVKYSDRGWPTFERAVASMHSDGSSLVDVGKVHLIQEEDWDYGALGEVMRSEQVRKPPMLPHDFFQILETKRFTNGRDLYDVVYPLYCKSFDVCLATAAKLNYEFLRWGDDEFCQLARVLPFCANLRALQLAGNECGDPGACALAAGLAGSTGLRTLSLDNNKIGEQGAEDLAGALAANSRLRCIRLAGNNIGDRGALRLAGALAGMTNLEGIYFSGNRIGDHGAEACADIFSMCKGLKTVWLEGNQISDDGKHRLRSAWQQAALPESENDGVVLDDDHFFPIWPVRSS